MRKLAPPLTLALLLPAGVALLHAPASRADKVAGQSDKVAGAQDGADKAVSDDERYLPEAPSSAEAAGRVLTDMEARVRELATQLKSQSKDLPQEEAAARRLTDAQVLFTFRNYEAAATILFDVVDRYANTKVHADALFYLGDALFQSRDYLSAKRFFEQLVGKYPQHARYQEALLRLVECALHLRAPTQEGQVGAPTVWIDKLGEIPKERTLAAVPYVLGKYYFLTKQYERALGLLGPILPQSPFYTQARYLLGATHVATSKLDEALSDFQSIVSATPRSDEERRVLELTHMALGRIFYEKGETKKAQAAYLQISQKSDLFIDALYESAWAAIRAKDFKSAQRSLQLMVLARPDALSAPEAKLLIGSLYIRLNDHAPATQWFQRTLEEFEPVYKRLDESLSQNGDAATHFRGLIAKNLSKFDAEQVLPKEAARYIKSEPEVSRFSALAGDVTELTRSLDEAEETVRRVETALGGQKRQAVDPDAAAARRTSARIGAGLMEVRRNLSELLLKAAAGVLSPEELAKVQELAQRRGEGDQRYGKLMVTLGQKNRLEQLRQSINELDKQASELAVELVGLRKLREAVEQHFAENRRDRRMSAEQFQKDVAQAAAEERRVTAAYDGLRKDLAEALRSADAEKERLDLAAQTEGLTGAMAQKEMALIEQLRGRLTGEPRQRVEALAALFARCRTLEQGLAEVAGTAGQRIDAKVAELTATLLVEKENLKRYRQALGEATGESEAVGGGIYAEATGRTSRRLYDIVVRADVGIIDVAWALKQQRTDSISRLVREQKRELKLLDDEFKEVLKKE